MTADAFYFLLTQHILDKIKNVNSPDTSLFYLRQLRYSACAFEHKELQICHGGFKTQFNRDYNKSYSLFQQLNFGITKSPECRVITVQGHSCSFIYTLLPTADFKAHQLLLLFIICSFRNNSTFYPPPLSHRTGIESDL